MWLWAQRDPAIHTLVVGAARPSDFDDHVKAARAFVAYERGLLAAVKGKKEEGEGSVSSSVDVVKEVEGRLMAAYAEAWAPWEGWGADWWVGLPDCYSVRTVLYAYMWDLII